MIDLHFKKLFDSNLQTPHPPGHLITETPDAKQSEVTLNAPTLTCESTNTMSNEQDTIESLRQQVESLRIQNEALAQNRQETLTLQRMVQEMMAERSHAHSTPGAGIGTGVESERASRIFNQYSNRTPISPSPLPRDASRNAGEAARPLAEEAQTTTPEGVPGPMIDSQDNGAQFTRTHQMPSQPETTGPAPTASTAQQPATPVVTHLPPNLHTPYNLAYYPAAHYGPPSGVPAAMKADRIKLSDLPKFSGKIGHPADLFHWQDMIEETFEIKNLTDDQERLKLLGSLLNNEELSAWYQANKDALRRQSWKKAMETMAMGTLPHAWLSDTEEALRRLQMKTGESFDAYVIRAQGLHRLVKRVRDVSDRNLAEYITWGAHRLFKNWVDREKLLLAEPFSFPAFKDAADGIWRFLTDSKILPDGAVRNRLPQTPAVATPSALSQPRTLTQPRTRSDEERADNAWRYHEYLRRSGICSVCKEKCNNPTCTRKNTRFLSVPADFNPGPRPARGSTGISQPKPAGAPTQRPAGRPVVTQKPSQVAAVESFPAMMAEDIAAYEEADLFQSTQVEELANGDSRSWDESVVQQDGE